jgi:uncharacterized protein YjbI with pentapeptide repeats
MIAPQRAAVTPRVFSRDSSEALPLEDRIQSLLSAGARGVVHLAGSPGLGKTTALCHLAAVLPSDAPLLLLDEGTDPPPGQAPDRLIVRATTAPDGKWNIAAYTLARWGNDDLIEYLLAVHHAQCASVLNRLHRGDHQWLCGIPGLWTIVLDTLAAEPSIIGARAAMRHHLQPQLQSPALLSQAQLACLDALTEGGVRLLTPDLFGQEVAFAPAVSRLLGYAPVQLLLGADCIAAHLRSRATCDYLAIVLPRELIKAAGEEIAGTAESLQYLQDLVAGSTLNCPMAASLLHAASPGWVPSAHESLRLQGAYLDGAAWADVRLPAINLREADLRNADLGNALLDGANVSQANMRHIRLARASLNGLRATEADLRGADLSCVIARGAIWNSARLEDVNMRGAVLTRASFFGSRLTRATLAGADLTEAVLNFAELEDADFTGAILRQANLSKLCLQEAAFVNACFAQAILSNCNMEGMDLRGLSFEHANLTGALLTGTDCSAADFSGALLRSAGLGDVNMEGACLRDADLRGATFHMGSSRSGLVNSPFASEGTRTGFYTDESSEQHFKAPEEIRKANLRGADLRGARIKNVDFYLVDLRDARYDAEQEEHFRRCRAIL